MSLDFLLWLGNPITWLVAMMMIAGWSRMFGRRNRTAENRECGVEFARCDGNRPAVSGDGSPAES